MSARVPILFNGDCNFLFHRDYRAPELHHTPYTTAALDAYVELLAESGVDIFVINVNGQVPWYPSRAVPGVIDGYVRDDASFVRAIFPALDETFDAERLTLVLGRQTAMLNRYLDLQEAGVDWLAYLVAACRRHGISPWASMRMNDAHGANSWESAYINCPCQRQPQYRLAGLRLDPRRGSHVGGQVCNYEHQAVRDYYFAIARELVTDYEIDGLELDWLRMPLCCEPPATAATLEMMTAWHGEIRELTKQSGRRLQLGLRTPCRLPELRSVGLDVAAMANAGIVDSLAVSNFWQTTWDVPYDQLRRELGAGVKLYGVIEGAPNWMFAYAPDIDTAGYRLLPASPELMRGNAAGKLALGVDGIEIFNFFCCDASGSHRVAKPGTARYDAISAVADLQGLRGTTKHYSLATSYNYWSPRQFEFAEQLPAYIESGGWRTFRLSLCAEPAAAGLTLMLQLVVDRRSCTEDFALGVSLNDGLPVFACERSEKLLLPTGNYTDHVPEFSGWNFRLEAAAILEGWNTFTVYHSDDACGPEPSRSPAVVRIVGLDLALVLDPS